MHGLAAFIMRGRWSAILVLAAASVVPFLTWLGGAALALVTLRRGVQDGLLVGAGAVAVVGLLYVLAGAPLTAVLRPVLELWLPVVAVSYWLRQTVSLAAALRFAAMLAAAGVLGFHLLVPEPLEFWRQTMEQAGQVLTAGDAEAVQAWQSILGELLPIMTGLLATTMLLMVTASVLLGRALQAALYNPGGFRQEFHALDFGRSYALAVAALLVGALFTGPGLVYDLALVTGTVFVLQALSLAHALVAQRGWSGGWLVVVYVLVPLVFQPLMIVGIADAAFNWRKRLGGPDRDNVV